MATEGLIVRMSLDRITSHCEDHRHVFKCAENLVSILCPLLYQLDGESAWTMVFRRYQKVLSYLEYEF